jgi:LysM repeat protein
MRRFAGFFSLQRMARMTRETKFGLLLVLMLTSVFGFMVYKKMHRPADLSAETSADEGAVVTASAEAGDEPQPLLAVPADATEVLSETEVVERPPEREASPLLTVAQAAPAKATPGKSATAQWPPAEDDPFATGTPTKPVAKPTARAPQPATEVDPFAGETPKPKTTSKAATPAPAFDPFSSPAPATTPAAVKPSAGRAAKLLEVEPDPFAAEAATPPAAKSNAARAVALPEDAFTAPATEAETTIAVPVEEADPLSLPTPSAASPIRARNAFSQPVEEATAESRTVIERMPALPTEIADPVESLPVFTGGPTYVVQNGDNYWTISKKVYGAGRFAQALAQHNAATISDPTKMRPGVQIATPPAEDLVAHYAALIPDSGATATTASTAPVAVSLGDGYVTVSGDNFWAISKKVYGTGRYFQALAKHNAATIPDPLKLQPGTAVLTPPEEELQARYASALSPAAGTVVTASTAPATTAAQTGFFVDADDQPKYRVGESDTLGGIAKAHLGRSSRWVQILEMNRDVLKDGNSVSLGTVLRLPADASQVQAAGFDRAGR